MEPLNRKQEQALKAARASASTQSRKKAGTKFYINQQGEDVFVVTETKNSLSIHCYKNGSEIAL